VNGEQLGMVGSALGGMTRLVATKAPQLKAVPFYGPNPPLEAVPDCSAWVTARTTSDRAGIPAIEERCARTPDLRKTSYPGPTWHERQHNPKLDELARTLTCSRNKSA
jgi:hypothetical protein